jgi:signal transduction histidine kinase
MSMLLIDANGRALYQSGDFSSGDALDSHPGVSEALRGETGTTFIRTGEDEHVVAYAPVEPVGWGIVTEESWEMLTTPALRTSQIMPLALVPALVIAVVGLWFGVRQVVQPIQKLEERAARLAWGDFGSIEEPVGGIAEVQHLQAELMQMAQKVRAAQQSLHDYIGAITRAQEDERRRLARELHDDTIQSLIALKQRVQLTRLGLKGHAATDSLVELETLAEQTIENLRRQTRALRPIYLEDLGLVAALEMLSQETSQSTGIPVDFRCQGEERRLSPEVELALYRIAQEALSNVTRHAQASHASVDLRFENQAIDLEVSDNGQGFEVPRSPADFAPSGHFGLLGLYERAELISARLEIRTAPGKGASIRVNLPVSNL